ncbi:hypothetical protein B0H13DRAFT_1853088 [Mycena leptocephala]|nr:hypothetical protein B0H13DRAFT_1853088 [Mycena leptocephala]
MESQELSLKRRIGLDDDSNAIKLRMPRKRWKTNSTVAGAALNGAVMNSESINVLVAIAEEHNLAQRKASKEPEGTDPKRANPGQTTGFEGLEVGENMLNPETDPKGKGLGTKHWVVPLRTSNSTFQQAMRLLATNPGDEDIMGAIESVLGHDVDAAGTH